MRIAITRPCRHPQRADGVGRHPRRDVHRDPLLAAGFGLDDDASNTVTPRPAPAALVELVLELRYLDKAGVLRIARKEFEVVPDRDEQAEPFAAEVAEVSIQLVKPESG